MMLSSGGFVMDYKIMFYMFLIVLEVAGITLSLYRIVHYRRHRHQWGPIIVTSNSEGLGWWGTMSFLGAGFMVLIYGANFFMDRELKDIILGILFLYPIGKSLLTLFVKGEIREDAIYVMEKIYIMKDITAYSFKDYKKNNKYYAMNDAGFVFEGHRKNIFGREKTYCFGFNVHNDDIPMLEDFLYRKGIKKVGFKEDWDKLIGA